MLVRPVEERELVAVGELTVAAYEPFLLGPTDAYAAELRDAGARARDAELYVAVDGDELLGSVTLCPDGSPYRELARGDEGEFRMLAVAPSAQGRGVGTALARFCLDRCREAGAPAVVLSSLTDMTGAHRIYARLGFERWPERDWRPGPDVLLWAFRKELLP